MKNEILTPDLVWHNEKRKISDLIPYERNPRKITEEQMKHLSNSLKKYNLVEVPTIDLDNTLIAGHQRTRALALMGKNEEEIDVRVPNRKLTPEEFKGLNIESNKHRGFYDFEMLSADFDTNDLLSIGFTELELGLGKSLDIDNKEIDIDGIGESLEIECPKCSFRFTQK